MRRDRAADHFERKHAAVDFVRRQGARVGSAAEGLRDDEVVVPVECESEGCHAVGIAHIRALRQTIRDVIDIYLVSAFFGHDQHVAECVERDLRGPDCAAAQRARGTPNRIHTSIVAHIEATDVAGAARVQNVEQIVTQRDADGLIAARGSFLNKHGFARDDGEH